MHQRKVWVPLVAATAALSVAFGAGCGGDDEASTTAPPAAATTTDITTTSPGTETETGSTTTDSGAGGQVIEIPAAEQGLAYQKTEVQAPAGALTLRMPNPSPIPHNIAIEEPENEVGDVVEQGGVSEVMADFPAGSFTYFCTVPGHREAGMEGTLTTS